MKHQSLFGYNSRQLWTLYTSKFKWSTKTSIIANVQNICHLIGQVKYLPPDWSSKILTLYFRLSISVLSFLTKKNIQFIWCKFINQNKLVITYYFDIIYT